MGNGRRTQAVTIRVEAHRAGPAMQVICDIRRLPVEDLWQVMGMLSGATMELTEMLKRESEPQHAERLRGCFGRGVQFGRQHVEQSNIRGRAKGGDGA